VCARNDNFNPASDNATLTISYGVLPLYDQTKSFKSGSTVPIKLQLSNVAGANVSSPSVTVTAVRLAQVSTDVSSAVQDPGNANPDLNFRYDSGSYIFNLSTKGLAPGTWQVIITAAGDPISHAVSFELR